jgi:hypothetical protein
VVSPESHATKVKLSDQLPDEWPRQRPKERRPCLTAGELVDMFGIRRVGHARPEAVAVLAKGVEDPNAMIRQ